MPVPEIATTPPGFQTTVIAGQDDAQKKRESAEAVTVQTTEQARKQSADLGEVLNRVQGVNIARTGGLGSDVRFSLNGLSKDQVRIFLNGLPLDIAGFAFNLASVPVNLVDRVEIYRGVVPIRFGADALGGAVNLVSPASYYRTGVSASLQGGSFATVRGSFGVRYRSPGTGLFWAATAYADYTKNDYDVDVQVPDQQGRLHDATVPRFHDSYSARGVIVDAGVVDRPWAQRILLRAHYSHYDKDLQNNPLMTLPYGAVTYDETLAGVSLQCVEPHALGHNVGMDAVTSYSHRITGFHDTSANVYDWFGDVIHTRLQPGEIDGSPHDTTVWRDSVLGRLAIDWQIARGHALRLISSLSYDVSHGISRVGILPGARDPLAAARTLLKSVSGAEYQADVLSGRVQNVAFVKHYYLHAASDELLTGAVFVPVLIQDDTAGGGDGIRVRLLGRQLYAKASYEYATRLPSPTEVFGDGILVVPNGTLVPERSHNGNLGLSFNVRGTRLGSLDGEINGLVRAADNLIVLLGNLRNFAYNNVFSARALGTEGAVHYLSPGDWVALSLSATYQDIRNLSTTGAYAAYSGDRVPNTPWLFANAAARVQVRSLLRRNDELSLTWFTRYVHEFYRDWESIGAPQYKLVVDAQVAHSLSLAYLIRGATTASFAFDIDNLTNARLYDVYGVQRPGRAFYGKSTVEF